jgi:hypothetical protein
MTKKKVSIAVKKLRENDLMQTIGEGLECGRSHAQQMDLPSLRRRRDQMIFSFLSRCNSCKSIPRNSP